MHEERGKRGQREIGHGIGRVFSPPLVGQGLAAAAQRGEEAVLDLHPHVESGDLHPCESCKSHGRPIIRRVLHLRLTRRASGRWISLRPEKPAQTPHGRQNENCWLGVEVVVEHAAKDLSDLVEREPLLPDDHRSLQFAAAGGKFARRDRAGNRSWRLRQDVSSAEVIGSFPESPVWPIEFFYAPSEITG